MQSFNKYFVQTQRHNDNQVQLLVGCIEALYIKNLICANRKDTNS